MRHLIPKNFCLTCDVCCRFLDKESLLRPSFLEKERRKRFRNKIDKQGRVILRKYNDLYICPFFLHRQNLCSIYRQRPLDCRLYPFIIIYNENKKRIILGLDKKCPFVKGKGSLKILRHPKELIELLEDKIVTDEISKVPTFIGDFNSDYIPISNLNRLTTKIFSDPQKLGYKKLNLEDKKIFDEYFEDCNSTYYCFVNLYIWKDLMDIWWKKIDGRMDILIEQDGNSIEFNKIKKYKEYICLRKDLAELKGDRFRHKRSGYNYFVKNYKYAYLPFKKEMRNSCLELFSKWMKERKEKYKDPYYHRLIDDCLNAQKIAMEEFEELGLTGRVVIINGEISAYTFGYELNRETFCILFEITDLNIKGLSQFIFREFCKELTQYKYINLMDDSGLENLKRVKESYRPVNL